METPELDRQLSIIKSGKAEVVQDFLDWLTGEAGYTICEPVPNSLHGYYTPATYGSLEQLMADYFAIDLNQVEAERRAILEGLRDVQ